jgi:hypothetical protein
VSRRTVRHAAAVFLATPQIPGVGTVFPSPPKISKSSDAMAGLPPGTPSGSVIYVEIMNSQETRIAVGGPTQGSKTVNHTLRLHLLFRSRQARAEDAMDDHDDQIEAILQRLRSNRTLGTAGVILQFGQDSTGISIATGMPKESGTGSTLIWSIIDGHAMEFLTA